MHEDVCNALAHNYRRFLDGLPKDWERKEIGHLGKVVGGGTPSRDVATYWRGAIPWVTPGEISGKAVRTLDETREHISAAALSGSGANVLPAGSLMVTTRATLGSRAINAVPMATNQGFKSVTFKQAADASFYFHFFEKVIPELVRRASGTTFLEISSTEFARIEVPSPSQDEKRVITEILDTCDAAIQKTEALIDNLKAIKQGLLHDLLTRGIDDNGRLRPPQAEAPRLYKNSPVGWVPTEWEVSSLQDLVCSRSRITYGVVQPGPEVDGGVLFIRGGDIFGGRILIDQLRTIGLDVSNSYGRTRLVGGELLMSLVGYPGEVGLVPPDLTGANIARQAALIRITDSATSKYVMHYLTSRMGKRQVLGQSLGSAQQVVNLSDVRNVRVPLPPSEERRAISERVEAFNEAMEKEAVNLGKLAEVKSALMDDLLTGRVRVTPLLERTAA